MAKLKIIQTPFGEKFELMLQDFVESHEVISLSVIHYPYHRTDKAYVVYHN